MKPSENTLKLHETLEYCYGCNQCISFCPFYPNVFPILEEENREKKPLLAQKIDPILNLCYDCKLCSTACPFEKDLPHDVLMVKSEYFEQNGKSFLTWLFGNIDLVQKWGAGFSGISNLFLTDRLLRSVLEKMVGLHKNRIMPRFYRQTFLKWFKGHQKELPLVQSKRKVAYFFGCFTNYHRPEEGMAAVKILEKNGIEVVIPKQICCGLPQYSEGDMGGILKFEENIQNLIPWIDEGYDIVVTSVPCSLTLKKEYPARINSDLAIKVASHTYDISEYLFKLEQNGELAIPESPVNTKIAYHVACHLKAQEIGYPAYELLKRVPGLTREFVDRGCCGLAGTMGYHKEGFEFAQQIGKPMIDGIISTQASVAVSDCPKCNLQIKQGTGMEAVHPLEIFLKGYKK
ncbi:MAG: anaerobic glycerol-3-phosphate dehydrogenase subunit C [Nitrospirae bacterium]|nr:anaerobic glycerol-3-phosphate dehydrogenase subunit C [Nitrospirota bacterium]MBI3351930.1 anaerobic glycerol-3-phosphate dehydrogenase subunit C [Nitrospirota bacterium]